MNLSGIFKPKSLGVVTPVKNPLSEVNTGSSIFITSTSLFNEEEPVFHVNMIYLLDKALLNNTFSMMSIDEERFIRRFLYEADKAVKEKSLDVMSETMRNFDVFLGNYRGVNDGQFTR